MGSRYKEIAENKAEAYRVYGEHLFSACDAVDALRFAKASDVINYTDNTHVITDYRYDSFGRRIHTAERTKSSMRTIYDGLSFEVVKEAETFLGTRGITSSATGEANLTNYTPQVPQNGGPNNTAPSYGIDHTKGTRYYYIPNNPQGAQVQQSGSASNTTPPYPSDHTKGTRYYYIPDNAQGAQAQHSAIPADRTKGVRTYLCNALVQIRKKSAYRIGKTTAVFYTDIRNLPAYKTVLTALKSPSNILLKGLFCF